MNTWTQKFGHLWLIVTSDWRFSCRQERSRTVLSPVSLLTSKKTCSLSLCGDTFLCSAACSHETFKNLNVWYLYSSLECDWNWPVGSKGISEVRRTDIHMCAYIHMRTLHSLPEWLHKSYFLRKPGWKKEWREVKQDTIQFHCSYCEEHLSNCLEYCAQSWLQCSRKAVIVLKQMRSCRIMKIMCCIS